MEEELAMIGEPEPVVSNYPRSSDLSQHSVTPVHARAALRVAPWLLAWMVVPTLYWSFVAFLNLVQPRLTPWIYLMFLLTALLSIWFLRLYAKAAGWDRLIVIHSMLLFIIGSIPLAGILPAFLLHVWVCRDLEQKGFPPLRGRIPTRALRALVDRARQRGDL